MTSSTQLQGFRTIWRALFTSNIKLDTALGKIPRDHRAELHRATHAILRQPASLARLYKIPLGRSPFTMSARELSEWPIAAQLAERVWIDVDEHHKRLSGQPDDYPLELVTAWRQTYGNEVANDMILALAQQPSISLRITHRAPLPGMDSVLKSLRPQLPTGVRAHRSWVSPVGITLDGWAPVIGSNEHTQGWYEMQDEGSQLMALFTLWPSLYAPLLQPTPYRVAASSQPAEMPGTGYLLSRPNDGTTHNQLASQRSGSINATTPNVAARADAIARGAVNPSPFATAYNTPRFIVDACAGAGGKTLAMGDALIGKGKIRAYDRSTNKLSKLKERASRWHMTSIIPKAVEDGNEEAIIATGRGRSDVVLVDAPCTGWGSLRRNPDIKWLPGRERQALTPVGPDTMDFKFSAERHLQKEPSVSANSSGAQYIPALPETMTQGSGSGGWLHTVQQMAQVQKRLLDTYSTLVRPGGRLVYGVCTFSQEETQGVVNQFLARHKDFTLGSGGYLGPGPCDGFFMQSLTRSADGKPVEATKTKIHALGDLPTSSTTSTTTKLSAEQSSNTRSTQRVAKQSSNRSSTSSR